MKSIQAILLFVMACLACAEPSVSGDDLAKQEKRRSVTPEDIVVRYVANEGVLISQNDTQVLIDGLHLPYGPDYIPTPKETIDQIMKAEAPFNSLDFILVSHVHGDHFSASLMDQFLDSDSEVQLFTSPQVIDSLANQDREQNFPMTYERGVFTTRTQGGARVSIGKIDHGSERFRWIQNLGHIVEIGGLKFLHIGDPGMGEEDLEALKILDEEIDVAILPDWFLRYEESKTITDRLINASSYIAVHVSPRQTEDAIREVEKYFPGSTVFVEPGQEVRFGGLGD